MEMIFIYGLSVVISLIAVYFSFRVYRAYRNISLGWGMLFVAASLIALSRILSFLYQIGEFPGPPDTFNLVSTIIFFATSMVICISSYYVMKMTDRYKLLEWKAMKDAIRQIGAFDKALKKNKRKK